MKLTATATCEVDSHCMHRHMCSCVHTVLLSANPASIDHITVCSRTQLNKHKEVQLRAAVSAEKEEETRDRVFG